METTATLEGSISETHMSAKMPIVHVRQLSVSYGGVKALKEISIDIPKNAVTSLIGPSGCGKSTFLRTLNRMNDRITGFRCDGTVEVAGVNVYAKKVDMLSLRRRVGMVFQKANPFPMSVYENVAIGPKMHYGTKGAELDQIVEDSLRAAAIWNEVKDDYKRKSGLSLSGGQQQRLCIARMLAVRPEVILMDEPCSALDPVSTAKIEDLVIELKADHTVVIVTHNLQQAERISDQTAFFMFGELVEYAKSDILFNDAARRETQDYVSGRFG